MAKKDEEGNLLFLIVMAFGTGIFAVLVGLGIIPTDEDTQNAPPGLIIGVGMAFICAGGALVFRKKPRVNAAFAALILAVFTGTGLWISFYAEPSSIQGGIPFMPQGFNDKLGRVMFGGGALICGALCKVALWQALGWDKKSKNNSK